MNYPHKTTSRLAIILAIVAITLSACVPGPVDQATPFATSTSSASSEATQPTPTPTSEPISATGDPNSLRGVKITFVHPWMGATQELLFRLVDQFNQTNEWGIHVMMTAPGSAAQVASTTWQQIASGQSPNILVAPMDLLQAINEKSGLVVDLNPYIEDKKTGMSRVNVEDFIPRFWYGSQAGDLQLGIPAQQSALFMAYNLTWVKELGFSTPPVSMEDFQKQVCAANATFIKDSDVLNDGLGGWIIDANSPIIYSWLKASGAEPYANGTYTFTNEQTQEAFTYLVDLHQKSCAWVPRTNDAIGYFTNRQALAFALWMQDIPALATAIKQSGSTDEWTIIPFPAKNGQSIISSGSSYAILEHGAQQDLAAWLFIRWLSESMQQVQLLQTLGTLPLSRSVSSSWYATVQSPQLAQAAWYTEMMVPLPQEADWQVVNVVLEDAAWQLLYGETSADKIPAVLEQMDELAKELSERYP